MSERDIGSYTLIIPLLTPIRQNTVLEPPHSSLFRPDLEIIVLNMTLHQ